MRGAGTTCGSSKSRVHPHSTITKPAYSGDRGQRDTPGTEEADKNQKIPGWTSTDEVERPAETEDDNMLTGSGLTIRSYRQHYRYAYRPIKEGVELMKSKNPLR